MSTQLLSTLRDLVEDEVNITSANDAQAYIDSTRQLRDINNAYEKIAYMFSWPDLLKRSSRVIVENVNRYALPTDFRKFHKFFVKGIEYRETEIHLVKYTPYSYTVDADANDYIIHDKTLTASTAYTLSGAETAGNAVVIELDTIDRK